VILWVVAALGADATDVVRTVGPSVVRVDVEGGQMAPELSAVLRHYDVRRRPGTSAGRRGSGLIVSETGDVLTNQHVVAGATAIVLTFGDGTTSDAVVVHEAVDLDLALLRPSAPVAAPVARWADDRTVGQPAFTLGFPAGPDLVVSAGILAGETERGLAGRSRRTWLLTDALVQRGASGGPLVDDDGHVLGISTGGHAADAGGLGLGLVLPAPDARDVLPTWFERAPTELGVAVEPTADGLRVTASDRPEVPVGTVIRTVDGVAVRDRDALVVAIRVQRSVVLGTSDGDITVTPRPLSRLAPVWTEAGWGQ
jgi:S1-C subfamily serine protease